MGQFSKDFKDLEFYDNFIFCKAMKNEDICKRMIKILLKLDVERIDYLNTEQQLEPLYDSKGIRMDVFIKDSDRVIDVEMQTGDYKDLILRSRYYQSSADVSTVPRRTKYRDLKENYILFICRDDPFGAGLPCYTKKSVFVEADSVAYDDKTHNVFYNASAYASVQDDEVRDVLQFIYTLKPSSAFTGNLAAFVRDAKVNYSFKDEYMYFQDILEDEKEQAREIGLKEGRETGLKEGRETGLREGREKGLEEGRERGLKEGRMEGRKEGISEAKKETALKLLKMNLSVEQIVEATGLTVEIVNGLA